MRAPVAAAILLAALAGLPSPRARADDVVLRAMTDELTRTTRQLRLESMAGPYFVSFRMGEATGVSASAELGSLTSVRPESVRRLTVELRVGDYGLDNSNYFSTRRWGGSGGLVDSGWAPIDDDYQQIRRRIWLTTDALYKRALEDLSAKKAALQERARPDDPPDFLTVPKTGASETRGHPCHSRAEIEALTRELSAAFRSAPEIRRSSVTLECLDGYVLYVNSEGTSFTRDAPRVKLAIEAETHAPSGMPISDSVEIYARSTRDLPPRKALLDRARELESRVVSLRTAPTLERYNGPVLFEGVAAAEIFGQRFAPGLVAARTPVSDDPRFQIGYERWIGQIGGASFADKIGGRVLPAFLSLENDPLRPQHRGTPLLGGYRIDDDGVAARVTRLVEHGTLKTLLTTRNPVREVRVSSGSRRGLTAAPANLIVTADRTMSSSRLRKELLRRAKARGLDFAIVVRRVGAGRASPLVQLAMRAREGQISDFSTAMVEVYRVFLDGRQELLQGVELSELTSASFKDIVAAGDSSEVHTFEFLGGAASIFSGGPGAPGGLPLVSCVVPALLFEEVTLVGSHGPFPETPVTPSPLAKAR